MAKIFLTSAEPALFEAVERSLEIEAVKLDPEIPGAAGEVDAWCFVDWVLDDMSGLELCRRLKLIPTARSTHITIVLDGQDKTDRARALAVGVDDYMQGPLTPSRLVERLRCYIASGGEIPVPSQRFGELVLDAASYRVRWQGRLVPVGPRECAC